MTHIPDNHPRAASLQLRERLEQGVQDGVASPTGLIAHGRGEAFYYLLGERTHDFARDAIAAASAHLLTARHPVFSINGNVAALAAEEIAALLADNTSIRAEANIFHFSEERLRRIAARLESHGVRDVLGCGEWTPLEGLESTRRRMDVDGIAKADVVFVPLEDGDRCEALLASGRKVITVDLNPLSRTAQMATVTIVDELTRVIPLLRDRLQQDKAETADALRKRIAAHDNSLALQRAVKAIRSGV